MMKLFAVNQQIEELIPGLKRVTTTNCLLRVNDK